MSGRSIHDFLVFGRRAGLGAADYAKGRAKLPAINPDEVEAAARELLAPFNEGGTENPYAVFQDLQQSMEVNAGIVRTKDDLECGPVALEALKKRAAKFKVEGTRHYNPGWHYTLDLRAMLTASEAITLSALNREESRGGHTRLDFPDKSPALEKVVEIRYVVPTGPKGETTPFCHLRLDYFHRPATLILLQDVCKVQRQVGGEKGLHFRPLFAAARCGLACATVPHHHNPHTPSEQYCVPEATPGLDLSARWLVHPGLSISPRL